MPGNLILIADDDPDDVAALLRVFHSAKILNDVRRVKNGLEAIAYLDGTGSFSSRDENPYPIVLFLDLKMPNLSGHEVLQHLQSTSRHRAIKVVVFTAMGDVQEIRKAYSAGAHSFLVKPVSVEDFHNLIRCLNGIELIPTDGGFRVQAISQVAQPLYHQKNP